MSELVEYLFNACGEGGCFDLSAKNVENYYRAGSGKVLTVDVSEIVDLLQDPGVRWTQDPKDSTKYVLSTFGKDGLGELSRSRVLGDITVQSLGDGTFKILNDYYNFNQQRNPDYNLRTGARNTITGAASSYVGPGKPFVIQFTGTFKPTVDPKILSR